MQIFLYTALMGFFILLLSLMSGDGADADGGDFHWIDLHLLGNFLTAFGSAGILASYLGGSVVCSYGMAFFFGLLAAYAGKKLIRLLRRFGNPGADSFSYAGMTGIVSTPVRGTLPGEVMISVSGKKNFYLQAYAADQEMLASGVEVVIVESIGNSVKVRAAKNADA